MFRLLAKYIFIFINRGLYGLQNSIRMFSFRYSYLGVINVVQFVYTVNFSLTLRTFSDYIYDSTDAICFNKSQSIVQFLHDELFSTTAFGYFRHLLYTLN